VLLVGGFWIVQKIGKRAAARRGEPAPADELSE
jgi:hypothetical protein